MSEATGSATDGLVGMMNVFVDPATTASKVPSRLSWLWPVLVLTIGYLVFAYLMMPYSLQLMDATLAKQNVPAESLDRTRSMMHMTARITTPMTPLFVIGFIALFALLIKVAYTMMDIRPKFRDVFSLLASCSLIGMLQYIAGYFVIRAKGDQIESSEQMTPPFGLDIFFSGIHGPLFGFLSFFSIFEIWFLVVLCIGLAYLTRSSKTKALLAITPAWLIPLVFRIIGSLFQKGPA